MHPPIACTLRPDELADRKGELAEFGRRALRSRRPILGGERFHFALGAEIEVRLREAVAAEASCCPFLNMDLRSERDAVVLEITGSAEAQALIREMFA